MATPQVAPRPSPRLTHPQPFPKTQIFEAIATLNRDLGIVIDDLNRLREFRFRREPIDWAVAKIERLRARSNSEFLERQLTRELKDDFHFWKLDRKFEENNRDPDDVLIHANQRLAELANEEQEALAFARGTRKLRRRAEKRLTQQDAPVRLTPVRP